MALILHCLKLHLITQTTVSMLHVVTAAESLATSKSRLKRKTHLFNQTFRPSCS